MSASRIAIVIDGVEVGSAVLSPETVSSVILIPQDQAAEQSSADIPASTLRVEITRLVRPSDALRANAEGLKACFREAGAGMFVNPRTRRSVAGGEDQPGDTLELLVDVIGNPGVELAALTEALEGQLGVSVIVTTTRAAPTGYDREFLPLGNDVVPPT